MDAKVGNLNLTTYRNSDREQARVNNLMRLVPESGGLALDLGARDGFISRLLAERFDRVVALDLEKPAVDHPRIDAVVGDASRLTFDDDAFDVVLCAEVLEHIPPPLLGQACQEIARVTRRVAIVGVPYREDLRVGRTLCRACGVRNPPWGHVNTFDEQRLFQLFPGMTASCVSFVCRTNTVTNRLSTSLLDFAGNPYGTYEQDEPCVECGARLRPPVNRSLAQRGATKLAFSLDALQRAVTSFRGNWIHVKFEKSGTAAAARP